MSLKVSYVANEPRLELIERLMGITGIKTKQALIDNALLAFEFAIDAASQGHVIGSIENHQEKDKSIHILRMPVLTFLQRRTVASRPKDEREGKQARSSVDEAWKEIRFKIE